MSTDIDSPPMLWDTSHDAETDCEREISAECENVSKSGSLSENCNSLKAESAGIGQREHDVVSDGNSKMNSTSQHHTVDASESDGGWGWVIVLGVFFISLFLGGVNISFSLLYLEFVDLFDASRAVVGWIGSLHLFMNNILGNNNSCLLCDNLGPVLLH